ncbi:MFS transporter [Geomonas ferrireducens]|uniref:MFS transporter n=1 Tax=Geomonas ferrireducens TaxID=2570227 RepID=UPI0010A8CDA8|nr:MFS transporter [Geomonas ferrireducens]
MGDRAPLKTLFLVNFAVTLGFGIADAFFPTYLFGLGARGIMLGLPLVLYSLSKIIFSPVLGACADRVGYRRIVLASLFLYLAVSVGYLCTRDVLQLILLRLVQGVSCAMFRPVILSMVGSATGKEERGRVMATFDISFYAPLGLGPLIGGALKDTWGYPGIFAAVTLLSLAAFLFALRRLPHAALRAGRSAVPGGVVPLLGLQRGSYRGLLAFIFGRACGISLSGSFLPILLSSKLGLSGLRSGLVLASGTAAMTLLLRPMGILSDRAPRPLLVLLGGGAVSLLYLLIPAATSFGSMLVLAVAIGVFSVVSQPASSALLVEEGTRYGMGATVGTFNAVLNAGFVAGPLLGALLQGTLGLTAVFHAAAAVGLAAVALFAAELWGGVQLSAAAPPEHEEVAVVTTRASVSCESAPPFSHAA